jgi:hypothetical protein
VPTVLTGLPIGDDGQYPPQSARQNRASQPEGQSDFIDGSGPIFSMYMEMAEEEDKKLAKSWKADADSILVFVRLYLLAPCVTSTHKSKTGLFSAAVASLISVSIQDLRQNPQDTSNFYLANLYQATVDPNRSSSLPASPPPFSPHRFAVWVNGLWFMSLVISITCAVLATLLQQWARRYLKLSQTRYSLHKRARIRTFFAEGVENSLLPWVVEALPTLIHVSLVLFFAGLAVFLWNVNLTIFKVVLSWVGVCTALYGCTMLISIVRRDSPYYTPLTPLALPIICVIAIAPAYLLGFTYTWLSQCCTRNFGLLQIDEILEYMLDRALRFVKTRLMAPEKFALLKTPPELDTRALLWTFRHLDEDHELVRFFSGLPSFHSSKFLKDPLRGLTGGQKLELVAAMIGFLDRTFSSDLISNRVKDQRADICEKAIDLLDSPKVFVRILHGLASANRLDEPVLGPVQSTEIVQFVRRWGNRKGEDTTPVIKAIFSIAVARVRRHDDSWFILASDEMAVPESVLRSHAARGDSLSLAILIYIARQQFIHFGTPSWPSRGISGVLESASKFRVQNTSPELQHEFCALWNQIFRKAQNDSDWEIKWWMLDSLHSVYTALHRRIDRHLDVPRALNLLYDGPSTYHGCYTRSHILDAYASTTFPRAVQHHDDALATASLTSPDAPSVSVPAPLVNENLATVPPPDNSHPTPVDSIQISLPSLYPSNAVSIQDIIASDYPTPEASTSPRSSTSPPAAVSLKDKEDLLKPSDPPNLPSPASDQVLDNILPTGPSLSAHLHTARTDLSPSFPESRHPITVPDAPNASLLRTPGPDPGTVAVDDGSPISSLCKEEHDLDPSVHYALDENTTPTIALPPQPPSLPSTTDPDMAVAGRSPQGPNAELTMDGSPDPSRYQYDIV